MSSSSTAAWTESPQKCPLRRFIVTALYGTAGAAEEHRAAPVVDQCDSKNRRVPWSLIVTPGSYFWHQMYSFEGKGLQRPQRKVEKTDEEWSVILSLKYGYGWECSAE